MKFFAILLTVVFGIICNNGDSFTTIPKKQSITLDELSIIAKKGNNITWNDFDNYQSQDIGFGQFVLKYGVENGYTLLVSGTSLDIAPKRVVLQSEDGQEIDVIRNKRE